MNFEVFKEPEMILLVFINAPVFFIYFKIIFGDWMEFGHSVKGSSQLDIISFMDGTLLDDWWHTAKILVFLFSCYKTVKLEDGYFFITA